MIGNRRRAARQYRSDTDEIAELERERARLLQERANSGYVHSVSHPPHHRRASRHPKPERASDDVEEQPMGTINELHDDEISSPRAEQRTSIEHEKILLLKKVIEEMLELSERSSRNFRTGANVAARQPQLQRQRNSSLANLHELVSNPNANHYRQHKYIHKQLEEIEEIESKVFKEILSLRDEKLQLMRDLNEETKRANEATREARRLDKELGRSRNPPLKTVSDSDKDSIINKLAKEEQAYARQDPNLRRNVADLQGRDKQRIIELQDNVLQLEDLLRAANAHIEELETHHQHSPTATHFQQEIHRLEAKLREAEAKNSQIQLEFGTDFTSLQEELAQLKADNEQLRIQGIEILQQPDRKFTYQKEIAHMKHEIEKENDAKAKLARDIRDFQRQFQMMEEENVRLRRRVAELEARAVIPELSREQSERQQSQPGQPAEDQQVPQQHGPLQTANLSNALASSASANQLVPPSSQSGQPE